MKEFAWNLVENLTYTHIIQMEVPLKKCVKLEVTGTWVYFNIQHGEQVKKREIKR